MVFRLLLALGGGGLLSVAFEPTAIAAVMPLSLAAFALATREVRGRAGLGLGLAFGAAFYFPHIYWMSPSIGLPAWLALAAMETVFYGLVGAVSPILQRLRSWPFWLAAAWTTAETVRSVWPFSGMPWGRLGFGVVDTPLAPALAYLGVNGVSFLVAALGFLLARLVLTARGDERLLAAAGLVGLAALAVTPTVVPWTLATTGEVDVAAIQGNVPGRGDDVLVDPRGLTENQVTTTERLADEVARGLRSRPDFVVWPENSTAIDPFTDPGTNGQIRRAVAAIGVPVLVGAIVDSGEDHILNQGIVWDPATGAGERYTKRHPVGFGEYIPFRSLLARTGITEQGQLARIPRDMLSGDRSDPLVVAGIPVADSICFDVAYDDGIAEQVERGAELMTVQTSNASFIFTDQIEQQFAITRARAIETGKYVVVASTNGVSGIIAPDGAVVERTERLTQDIVQSRVELRAGVTPGVRVGRDLRWVLPVVSVVGLLLALGALPYPRRDTTTGTPTPDTRRADVDASASSGPGPDRHGRADVRRGG